MREIKFKAWDRENKRWVKMDDKIKVIEGEYSRIWDQIIAFGADNTMHLLEDLCFDIVQYTGLKDKNGREIYEGDLIRTDGFSEGYSEPIIWKNCMFQIGAHGIIPLYYRADYEVIGNIYDNPELLEKGVK